MEDNPNHDPKDDVIEGVGITVGEMQIVARRQLVGSVVVAVLVVAMAGLAALRPVQKEAASLPGHTIAVIRQPTFATPLRHDTVAIKNTTSAP